LKVKPRDTVYVGDSRYDIMAAKAAGIPFLFASWGTIDPTSVLELHPDFYLKEPIEILDVVQKKTQVEAHTQLNYQNM
jgi:phosphoglycolate phosphatase-like HAD superfamily hydrolase